MGIHSRRGFASNGGIHETTNVQDETNANSKGKKTKKYEKGIYPFHHIVSVCRIHGCGATNKPPASLVVLFPPFLLLLLVGVKFGLVVDTNWLSNKWGTRTWRLSYGMRAYSVTYLDVDTHSKTTRTIRLGTPHRQLSHGSLNYVDGSNTPWFDFNDPDQGVAFEEGNHKQCFPMASWQTEIHQSCNHFYEQEIATQHTMLMRFINCGENRCTFLLENGGETFVLKTLILRTYSKHPNYFADPSRYKMAKKDSLALERLTSSPYVVNIYGACGVAQIVEYSSGGNIHDLLKRSRLWKQPEPGVPTTSIAISSENEDQNANKRRFHVHEDIKLNHSQRPGSSLPPERMLVVSPITKLKIAYHVASAVADMHAVEDNPYGLPSISHNDLCCHQFMLVDGVYKLGDFDWATMLTQTKPFSISSPLKLRSRHMGTPEACQTTPLKMSSDYLKGLAPEELLYYDAMEDAFVDQGEKDSSYKISPVYRDKLDVYQVGSIMYTLTTNRWIWEEHPAYEAMVKVVKGRRSPFPTPDETSWNERELRAYKTLREAITMAWTHKPDDRPSARELSKFLKSRILELVADQEDPIRVSIPPLPPNYRYTDSDYNANWEYGE